ncbi:MAG: MMPL family transporter [Planctomycetota bacterium]
MLSQFGRVADWIIDHQRTTFTLLVVWTSLMAIGHYDPYLLIPDDLPLPSEFIRGEDDEKEADREAAITAPSSESAPRVSTVRVAYGDVIVVAQSESFFSPDGSDAIRAAVDAIENLDVVNSVLWMDQAPMMNVFGLPEPILPSRNASPTRFEAAKRRALDHPLVAGQLLSPDAKTMLLMVSIDWLFVIDDKDCTDLLRDTATEAVAQFPDVDIRFSVTGEVPIQLSRAASTRANELKYQAIGYSIALLIAFVLFRGLSAVVIVAMAPAFGVFWTLGLLHFIGFDDSPFNSVIVPVLLCMVGFTDGVHMMVQIRRHRAAGMPASDAARQSIREVGLACWLTSLTTAIGFGSLALAHHPLVREFGYSCVIGVLMTFISVITVIPLACTTPLGKRVATGYGKNLVDKNLSRVSVIIDFVLRRSRLMSALAIAATLMLGLMTLKLRPDERLTSNLAANSEPAATLAHIDKAFGGMETAVVRVRWHPDVKSNDGEIATVVQKVDDILREEELIGHPLSIRNLIDALPGEGDCSTRMSLLDLLPPELKRTYFVPESRRARVEFRLQDLGIAAYGPVFERIEEQLNLIESEHPLFLVELGGGAVWRWKNLYRVVLDLAYSLGTASVIIFAVLTFVYRSLRLGLISIVPNLFPLAATGSLMWIVGQNLEIVSVCAFTVCLGIAVDDTIHFLTRYREELQSDGAAQQEAIRRAFVGVGTALIMTTAVLVIGFSTALLSDSRDHRIFAMMGILTIGSALFADLVFLPALLKWGGKKPSDASDPDPLVD